MNGKSTNLMATYSVSSQAETQGKNNKTAQSQTTVQKDYHSCVVIEKRNEEKKKINCHSTKVLNHSSILCMVNSPD